MELEDILKKLVSGLPGFLAAGVASVTDGLSVGTVTAFPTVNPDALSAHAAGVVQVNLQTMDLLNWEQDLEDILISSGQSYFLIRHSPGKPYCFFLMIRKDAWLGKARLIMKEFEKAVAQAVE